MKKIEIEHSAQAEIDRLRHALTVIAEGCEEKLQDWQYLIPRQVAIEAKKFVEATGKKAREALGEDS